MNTTIKQVTPLMIYLFVTSLLLSGCFAKPWVVKPDSSYLDNNITIHSVEVTKTDSVDSDTIVSLVEATLKDDVDGLTGAKRVAMKVSLTYLTKGLPGGSVTGKLLGSDTTLKGTVTITASGKVIARYDIAASHSEGGLLGKTTTVSFINVEKLLAQKFSSFAIGYMN